MIFMLLLLATTFVFGIFIGALLAEGALLVPYWRTLEKTEFFKLHKVFGQRLYRFYAPLTISATVLTVANMISCLWISHANKIYSSIAAVLAVSMVIIYFLYFQKANAGFASGSEGPNGLQAELAKWATWHWIRVTIGFVAFASLIMAVKLA